MIIWIAVLSMLVDHVNWVFIQSPYLYLVGRIAAPIFCFFVGAGWFWSRSKVERLYRFLIFACVSQVYYIFCFPWGLEQLNILFLFWLFGLLVVCPRHFWSWGVCLLGASFVEYGFFGLLACAAGYFSAAAVPVFNRGVDFVVYALLALACLFLSAFGLHGPALWSLVLFVLGLCLFTIWAAPVLMSGRYGLGRFAVWYFYPAHLAVLGLAAGLVS